MNAKNGKESLRKIFAISVVDMKSFTKASACLIVSRTKFLSMENVNAKKGIFDLEMSVSLHAV